ncbi:MAG: MlaD protein [Verrucomicrobiota bacterium]
MALHDLTPQLRTRLSRMERAVGWFVILATALLAFGFAYYVYNTAERKGWFKTKAPYFTFTDRGTGLKVGDPVKLMGFDAGEITDIKPMPAEQFTYNVYIEFELKSPNYDYMWTEGSRAKVTTADLLGKRLLEVTKGEGGYPTYTFYTLQQMTMAEAQALPDLRNWALGQEVFEPGGTNILFKALTPATNLAAVAAAGYDKVVVLNTSAKRSFMTGVWDHKQACYQPYNKKKSKPYWLMSEESAAVTERLESLVGEVEKALPNILNLTNQLSAVLISSTSLTSNLNAVAISARPAISNLAAATARLDQPGGLGEWLLPTNVNRQLEGAVGNANLTLANANSNLTVLVENLGRTLDNLASLTGNLNGQVHANTNVLSQLSRAIVDADDLVQGLKRHWLLRSAFKKKPAPKEPPPAPARPSRGID